MINLKTAEIDDFPKPGEVLAVVVAGLLLGFELIPTGLIVTKLTEWEHDANREDKCPSATNVRLF